jgi:hypothetical protein
VSESTGLRVVTDNNGMPKAVFFDGRPLHAARIEVVFDADGLSQATITLDSIPVQIDGTHSARFYVTPPGACTAEQVSAIEWADGTRWEAP